ncbi:MAG TPA: amidohydrolase family protein [Terriglobales bacterium]|nr:amidohydrolase family protein [Terriglobales bacterium]
MRRLGYNFAVISSLVFTVMFVSQALFSAGPNAENNSDAALKAFSALHPIDVHVHVFKTDAAFQAMLERLQLKLMNILVIDDTLPYRKQLQPQIDDALALVGSSDGHIALCTTFDAYKFDSPSFSEDAIRQIDKNFAEGAVAVKIWKNIGMEIKDRNGKYIMADDAKFEPIYQDIARHGKTLMTHQAEPDVAWGPADPADPSWSYYQENPQWYVGDKPGFPAKQAILAARDHVIEANPKLRVVGVHLGSMEKSLDQIAERLDKYPNFAIDTAARMEYLMLTPREQVRNFLIKYQDRVLYGTDLDFLASAQPSDTLKDWNSTYARDWKYLATDEVQQLNGKPIKGLAMPQSVLHKLFHDNARHWIPGL